MTQQICQSRQAERGFTLVELAIVMIIIGLLIGGILKGQELIANARVTSQVSQVKGVDAAMTTFRDQYAALPGDIATPATRLPNCPTTILCGAAAGTGNGDGFVAGTATANDPGAAGTGAQEGGRAFIQLGAAGLLGGVNPTLAAYGAGALPDASIGTGLLGFGYSTGAALTGKVLTTNINPGHYLVLRSTPTSAANTLLPLQVKTLANIDRKLDDGSPNAGSVIAVGGAGGAATCASSGTATAVYNENLTAALCSFGIRIQQ